MQGFPIDLYPLAVATRLSRLKQDVLQLQRLAD